MAIVVIRETYSDHDMQCPAEWENGFKEGIVSRFGDGERTLSHPFTGEWQGSTFELEISDHRRRFRQLLASATGRFWTEPQEIKMTTRANRAALGIPYTVWVGPIIAVQPTGPLGFRFTFSDIISQGLLADQHQIPWRVIGDSFINEATFVIADTLDRNTPEPIIYGQHRRIPDVDPPSPQGFQVVPTYLGIEGAYHVWMVAGHACADLPEVLVWTPDPDEEGLGNSNSMLGDPDWLIPHTSAPAYEDRRSTTYGNDRRYTLIRALVGNADADDVVGGEKVLAVFVDGVEPNGDGTGIVILDRLEQYKHFLVNFVANRGALSYQSGAWLTNPTWALFDQAVDIVDEASFDACSAIALERLPTTGSPSDPAYIGAAIIGASAGDRSSVRRWLSDWNRSCGVQFGVSHLGQLRVFMLHPTEAIKAAAPLYTDAYEILKDSFGTDVRWSEMANRIPFKADYEHTSGVWKTTDIAEAAEAIQNYGRDIVGEVREYPFAPGITMSYHLARLEALRRQHPARFITLEATIGHDYLNQSLGYLDLGDYIRYQHFAAVGEAAEIRLAQIVRHQVQAGKRRVLVEALDCEDLIDYDLPPVYDDIGSPINDTCASAIEIIQPEDTPLAWTIDTTAHQTDTSMGDGGSPSVLPEPGIAYHAAWWKYTPPSNGTLFLTTVHSEYDTQIAVLTGICGSSPAEWTLEQYNDNDGILRTSVLEFAVTSGIELYILVYGYGPDDGGSLTFGSYFTTP